MDAKIPKIIINCEPKQDRFLGMFSAVINVSDTPCRVFNAGIPSFWFPIHETGNWGYAPFYGSAKVADRFAGLPILIHCHAGVNRSVCVSYALLLSNGASEEYIRKHYDFDYMRQMYEHNVARGCIPLDTIAFLKARFQKPTYGLMGLLQYIHSPNLIIKSFK